MFVFTIDCELAVKDGKTLRLNVLVLNIFAVMLLFSVWRILKQKDDISHAFGTVRLPVLVDYTRDMLHIRTLLLLLSLKFYNF